MPLALQGHTSQRTGMATLDSSLAKWSHYQKIGFGITIIT
jgi:hypothetical protein